MKSTLEEMMLFPPLDREKLEEHAFNREVRQRQLQRVMELATTKVKNVPTDHSETLPLNSGSSQQRSKKSLALCDLQSSNHACNSARRSVGSQSVDKRASGDRDENSQMRSVARMFQKQVSRKINTSDLDRHLQEVLDAYLPKLFPERFGNIDSESQEEPSNRDDDGVSVSSLDTHFAETLQMLDCLDPSAARSTPYLFDKINSVVEASHSLNAFLAGKQLQPAVSVFPTNKELQDHGFRTFLSEHRKTLSKTVSRRRAAINQLEATPLQTDQQRKECSWTYPGNQAGGLGDASTLKPVLPFTPLVQESSRRPLSTDVAAFRGPSNSRECPQTSLDNRKVDVEDELMRRPAPLEDMGPWFHPGQTGRLQRRYLKQPCKEVLDLSHSLYGKQQMGALVEFLLLKDNVVEDLRLENNAICDKDLDILVNGLKRKGGMIQRLNLARNNLTAAAIHALIPLLKYTTQSALLRDSGTHEEDGDQSIPHAIVQELILSGNGIGDRGTSALCQTLLSNSARVVTLEISNCGLGEAGALALGELLAGTRVLKHANLSWNNFGVKGGRVIGEGMRCNRTVASLDLQWCGLRDKGSSFMINMLDNNGTLESLDLSGNGVSLQTCAELASVLRTNASLKTLALRESPVGVHGARMLMQCVTAGDCRYIDIRGCSFLKNHNMNHVTELNPQNPNGEYSLDLADSADSRVAKQLLELARDHGVGSWTHSTLNAQPFHLKSKVDKDGNIAWDIPDNGQLTVKFVGSKRPSQADQPLADHEFESLWNRLAADKPSQEAPTASMPSPNSDTTQTSEIGRRITKGSVKSSMFMTEHWKLELLEVLCWDHYFTCEQAKSIVDTFTYGRDKVRACTTVFGRIIDPENFSKVTLGLRQVEQNIVNESIGVLSLFHPGNPTGTYDLILGQQAHYTVAKRLIAMFCQQYDAELCQLPYTTPVPVFNLDGKSFYITKPKEIKLPREGRLKISFVDLRPVPLLAEPLDKDSYWLLINRLTSFDLSERSALKKDVTDRGLTKVVSVLHRFRSWDGVQNESTVQDRHGLLPSLRHLAIQHYITATQLCDLLDRIPPSEGLLRVEVVCLFWARIIKRNTKWHLIIQTLRPAEQVLVCQRLGYANVFDPQHPEMRYQLRMCRPDDYSVAHKLYKLTLNSHYCCIENFTIDGIEKKVVTAQNLWSLMKGNCQDGMRPDIVIAFDFFWPDDAQLSWAATMVQAAWKAKKTRRQFKAALGSAHHVQRFIGNLKKAKERKNTPSPEAEGLHTKSENKVPQDDDDTGLADQST